MLVLSLFIIIYEDMYISRSWCPTMIPTWWLCKQDKLSNFRGVTMSRKPRILRRGTARHHSLQILSPWGFCCAILYRISFGCQNASWCGNAYFDLGWSMSWILAWIKTYGYHFEGMKTKILTSHFGVHQRFFGLHQGVSILTHNDMISRKVPDTVSQIECGAGTECISQARHMSGQRKKDYAGGPWRVKRLIVWESNPHQWLPFLLRNVGNIIELLVHGWFSSKPWYQKVLLLLRSWVKSMLFATSANGCVWETVVNTGLSPPKLLATWKKKDCNYSWEDDKP